MISDIDECTIMPPVCSGSMVCKNTVGSYECKCRSGTVEVGDACKGNHAFFQFNTLHAAI